MNIKIYDDKYIIKSDSNCYRLVELREKITEGEELADDAVTTNEDGIREATIGYYTNLEFLLKDIIEREQRDNRCTTLEGFAKHLKAVNKRMEEVIQVLLKYAGGKSALDELLKVTAEKLPKEYQEEKPKSGKKKKSE